MVTVSFIITAILAVAAIFGWYKNRVLHLITKLATTISIIIFAWLLYQNTPSDYGFYILLGLIFSVFGDSFLMFEEKFFIHGLVSFLIAHILYIVAFLQTTQIGFHWWLVLIILIFGITVGKKIVSGSGEMKIPVTVYLLVIVTMLFLSWEKFLFTGEKAALAAGIGATIFLISDTILAWDKFLRGFSSAKALILATYYLGQWLIAYSLL